MAVIVTIASTEGAIAAVLAVIAGEVLVPGAAPILALIAIGVAITAAGAPRAPRACPSLASASSGPSLLAIGSAACFGIGLYASGRLSSLLPIPWAILPPRAVGTLLVVLPLIFMRRLRLTRAAAPYVVAVGLAEVFGYISYVIGAQQAIAISAVLATLFAPISAVAAYFLFRERARHPSGRRHCPRRRRRHDPGRRPALSRYTRPGDPPGTPAQLLHHRPHRPRQDRRWPIGCWS